MSDGEGYVVGTRMSHLAMETQDKLFSHRRFPSRWCQDEGVGGTRLLRIDVELLGFPCGLRACSGDHKDVLEPVGIERGSCKTDGAFALLM
jgi:hypothetical protein